MGVEGGRNQMQLCYQYIARLSPPPSHAPLLSCSLKGLDVCFRIKKKSTSCLSSVIRITRALCEALQHTVDSTYDVIGSAAHFRLDV